MADQWMSGSIGFFQRIVSRANSRNRRNAGDLVEVVASVGPAHLDPVFLDHQRHEVAAVAVPVALDAADLVEEGRQDARVGVAHAGEGDAPRPRTAASIRGWLPPSPTCAGRSSASWMSPSKKRPWSSRT
jgi:hypothetical protein